VILTNSSANAQAPRNARCIISSQKYHCEPSAFLTLRQTARTERLNSSSLLVRNTFMKFAKRSQRWSTVSQFAWYPNGLSRVQFAITYLLSSLMFIIIIYVHSQTVLQLIRITFSNSDLVISVIKLLSLVIQQTHTHYERKLCRRRRF